jgi:hypothetical protein
METPVIVLKTPFLRQHPGEGLQLLRPEGVLLEAGRLGGGGVPGVAEELERPAEQAARQIRRRVFMLELPPEKIHAGRRVSNMLKEARELVRDSAVRVSCHRP